MIREIIILTAVIAVGKGQQMCKTNESFQLVFCDNICSTLGQKCTSYRPMIGCFCDEGYARDSSKNCILKSECCTNENERYEESGLEETCDGYESTINEGCFCNEGYVRGANKVCIVKSECPLKCKANEHFKEEGCDSHCNEKDNKDCEKKPDCYCVEGYMRNTENECVKQEDCPLICEKENEEFKKEGCDKHCNEKDKKECEKKPDCYCAEGYFRNSEKECVKREDCPPICEKENEEPSNKGCDRDCDGRNTTDCTNKIGCFCKVGHVRMYGRCIPVSDCLPICTEPNQVYKINNGCDETCEGGTYGDCSGKGGCFCVDDHLRNLNGTCVQRDDCPIRCENQNEEFKKEGCDKHCNEEDNEECEKKPDCYCSDGYFRNSEKECVRQDECPLICKKENEEFKKEGCDKHCNEEDNEECENKRNCYCAEGYFRNSEKECVRQDECPLICKKENEEFKKEGCDKHCNEEDNEECENKRDCYCAEGYFRNSEKECVKQDECPLICKKKNEEFKKEGCDKHCNEEDNEECENKRDCYCAEGYFRNSEKECVRQDECPLICKKENEEFKKEGCDKHCNEEDNEECENKRNCYCAEGYFRNSEKECVRQDECPLICKKENEEFKKEGCDKHCNEEDNEECENKRDCYCAEGYFRNSEKECVKQDECPLICKKKNEEFKKEGCDKHCNEEDNEECENKRDCYCAEGYFRNSEKECVRQDECPLICKKENEEFKKEGCDKHCNEEDNEECENKRDCYCAEGYFRNSEKECVRQDECPLICKKENEEFKKEGCDKHCNEEDNEECENKRDCYCAEGYFRNSEKECVRQDECPLICKKENEEFKKEGCDKHCNEEDNEECENKRNCYCAEEYFRNSEKECVRQDECPLICKKENEEFKKEGCDKHCNEEDNEECENKRDCYCAEGYFRNSEKECVKQDECPLICKKKNEEFKKEGCDKHCNEEDNEECENKRDCYCAEGYFRNSEKECVRQDECPLICKKENEEFKKEGCDKHCNEEDNEECENKRDCYCAEGYFRNSEKECVRQDECPLICKKENEEFKKEGCDKHCNEEDNEECENKRDCYCAEGYFRNSEKECVRQDECPLICKKENEEFKKEGCDKHCNEEDNEECENKRDCYCAEGYFRNSEKECVKQDECPLICKKENEEFKEEGCDKHCNEEDNEECENKRDCYCAEGYFRNSEKECVKQDECPIICKKENEEFKEEGCDKHCNEEDNEECENKRDCYCAEGYFRNSEKECVKQDECPLICKKENEEFKKVGCDKHCNEEDNEECENKRDCYCAEGYFRNSEKECVKQDECPLICKKENEEFKEEGCDKHCNEEDNEECLNKRDCYCAEGYFRNSEKECVKQDECPLICKKENEEFKKVGCDKHCNEEDNEECENNPDCYCAEGYFRNSEKECVKQDECPLICKKENEEFKKVGCDKHCNEEDNEECENNPDCYCAEGYFRNSEKECVKQDECPLICKKENEEFKEEGCDKHCNEEDNEECLNKRDCYCAEGYFRNSEKECVKQDECPLICKKENEEFKKVGCDKHCNEEDNEECENNPDCYCAEGYFRNSEKECVKQDECPLICKKENEEFKKVGCDKHCNEEDNEECENNPDCYCAEGYFRNSEKECVKQDECPLICKKENEEFKEEGCDKHCNEEDNEECLNKRDCYCAEGYFRNSEKECVKQDECPLICKKENEEFKKVGCDKHCNEEDNEECENNPDCYCAEGYFRNSEKECVKQDECPLICKKENEEFKKVGCDKHCNEEDNEECENNPDCYCAEGYFRNSEKECVKLNQCPLICENENEESSNKGCDRDCDGRNTTDCTNKLGCFCKVGHVRMDGRCIPVSECLPICTEPNQVYKINDGCDKTCEGGKYGDCSGNGGCFCVDDHLRNLNGTCVQRDECPSRCGDQNEEYMNQGCDTSCDLRYYGNCPGKAGCYCKKGNMRNRVGKCVPKQVCADDPPCNANEYYVNTTTKCDVTCTGFVQSCNATCSTPENGCYCADGYARNAVNVCVPKKRCSPPQCSGPNELFFLSKDAPICDNTCSSFGLLCNNTEPKTGCYCAKGFARDLNGICVNVLSCKDICHGANEIFLPQGVAPACDSHCNRPSHECCGCLTNPSPSGCYCIDKYSRNSKGRCIPTDLC